MSSRLSAFFIACVAIITIASARAAPTPLGLPVPRHMPASEDEVRAGRLIFFDASLSEDGSISCSSCHSPDKSFADGRRFAEGIRGQRTTRNAPSILNVAYNASQFWDGRRTTLEEQATDPFFNSREHGLRNAEDLLGRVRGSASLRKALQLAYGIRPEEIDITLISRALAAYERTLLAGNSSFDRYQFGGDGKAMSAAAVRGLALFVGPAKCSTCHLIGEKSALLTDQEFHSVNVGLQKIAPRLAQITARLVESRRDGTSLDQQVLSQEDLSELGRFSVTLRPADIGKFKTPSLRDVEDTAPYMHDGSVPTLEEAVDRELYRASGDGRPLILTPNERADLVALLLAFTSAP